MAKINDRTKEIEFELDEIDAAWNNAIILANKDKTFFRMCYICHFHMERKKINAIDHTGSGWTIDLINAKKPVLEHRNYIAVHENCVPLRKTMNASRLIKKMKKMIFEFNEEYWANN